MTLGEFRKWSASLPDTLTITSLIQSGCFPLTAKRAALARYKDGGGELIVINPMGTHFRDDEDYDLVSTTCGKNVDAEGKAIA